MFDSRCFLNRPSLWVVPISIICNGMIANAAPPAWWSAGDHPAQVPDIIALDKNQGMANIGQAKYMVAEALRVLDVAAPLIAAQIRTDLNGPPAATTPVTYPNPIVDLTVPGTKTPEWLEKQKAPLLLGQLKSIAHPFYARLNTLSAQWVLSQMHLNHDGLATAGTHYWQVTGNTHYTEGGYVPWNPTTSSEVNKAPATIGQLKVVFSLRFEDLAKYSGADGDGDGLADSWESTFFGGSTAYSGASDVEPDGATNLTEYRQGTDPTKRDHPAVGLKITRAGIN
ncbi:MAG: hypothetical protein ABIS50_07040 [Luteolibacter sp.]|uniref:hypothetical protein n=1 Tax=Luteolibacter sp. TaxID=1962973 RepID=UPI003263F577